MPNCSVFCCKKGSGTSSIQKDGVTFHIFPKDPELREAWKIFCNRKQTWCPKRTSVICSTHFLKSDFQVLANNRRRLVENSIPTVMLHCVCASHVIANPQANRSATPIFVTPLGESSSGENQIQSSLKSTSQIDNLSPRERKMQNQIDNQKKKIKRLQAKNLYLKKKVAGLEEILHSLDEKSLIDKEEKMILKTIGIEEKELIQRQQKRSKSGKLSRVKYSPELRCLLGPAQKMHSPNIHKINSF